MVAFEFLAKQNFRVYWATEFRKTIQNLKVLPNLQKPKNPFS